MSVIPLDGPYYEELRVGQEMPRQPSVVIDDGMAALYQSMVGERLPMVMDPAVCEAVTGRPGRLASPALVMHLSIGHSTTLTRRAIANLFYRDVRLLKPVVIGQSLATTVTVAALADSRPRLGRSHRGKVLVDIVTTADGEPAVTYQRAPLLPQRGDAQPGHDDDLGTTPPLDLASYVELVPADWDFAPLGPGTDWQPGATVADPARDVVDNALALVRLTNNLAMVHRDAGRVPVPAAPAVRGPCRGAGPGVAVEGAARHGDGGGMARLRSHRPRLRGRPGVVPPHPPRHSPSRYRTPIRSASRRLRPPPAASPTRSSTGQ